MLGRPWLQWQRQVADVVGERLPDGRYAYPIAVVLVPRQCGKTTFAFDLAIGRGLQQLDYRAAYTAQTGHVVTERFGDRFTELEGTVLTRRVRTRRSAGTERISLQGRSYVKAFPPKDGALRGSALDLVIVDEAQEHDDVFGAALDRTILPVFATRPRRQLLLVGTAGTDSSGYLRRYLEAARAGEPGFAVFEWGAHDGDDLDDEAIWSTRHPGVGTLTDVDMLRTARSAMGAAGFAREFLNVWTRTTNHVIPPDEWRTVQRTSAMPPGRLCLAIDVAFDRTHATIAIGGPRRHLEVVDVVTVERAAARALELQGRHGAPIAIDNHGPTATVHDELERAGADLLTMTSYDVAVASAGFLDAVKGGSLSIWPHPALDEAVAVAGITPLGDGFKWSARASGGSIAALRAITFALWGAEHLPAVPARPVVHAG